jgi:hypothetical protein
MHLFSMLEVLILSVRFDTDIKNYHLNKKVD